MSDFRDVARAGSELAVTIGIIEAAIDQGHPGEVRDNFQAKVDEVVRTLERETEEFMQFGEVYD